MIIVHCIIPVVLSSICILFTLGIHVSHADANILLASNETSEQLVLQAHQYDKRAMRLTALGYALGVDGFPQEPFIARAWGQILLSYGDFLGTNLIDILLWRHEANKELALGHRIFQCETVIASEFESFFTEQVISKVQAFCNEMEAQKSSVAGWEKIYQKSKETEQFKEGVHYLAQFMRERSDMISPPKEPSNPLGIFKHFIPKHEDSIFSECVTSELLPIAVQLPPEVLLFYAATRHHLTTEKPDWEASRLIGLFDSFRTVNDTASKTLASLEPAIIATLTGNLSGCPEETDLAKLFGTDHKVGQTWTTETRLPVHAAMRGIAEHYQNGTCGFSYSPELAEAWLLSAAVDDDPRAQATLAVKKYGQGNRSEAWFWAFNASASKELNTQTRRTSWSIVKRIGDFASLPPNDVPLLYYFMQYMKDRADERIVRQKEAEKN